MYYKILERESTVLLFSRDGDLNPTSSFQIMRVGDRAMIHSLIGEGFYKILSDIGIKPFLDMGVRHVYAAVSPAHYRLMRNKVSSGIVITLEGDCFIDGHKFKWIKVTNETTD